MPNSRSRSTAYGSKPASSALLARQGPAPQLWRIALAVAASLHAITCTSPRPHRGAPTDSSAETSDRYARARPPASIMEGCRVGRLGAVFFATHVGPDPLALRPSEVDIHRRPESWLVEIRASVDHPPPAGERMLQQGGHFALDFEVGENLATRDPHLRLTPFQPTTDVQLRLAPADGATVNGTFAASPMVPGNLETVSVYGEFVLCDARR